MSDDRFLSEIKSAIGAVKVLTGAELSDRYTHIWRMNESLVARAVVLPTSTADVSAVLKICHAHRQPVVVHGGLTNLTGGTRTRPDDLVLSLEKMNVIEETDTAARTLTVQAGAILEDVQNAAAAAGMLFPMNYGAKGSAQIGGMVASNAGGLKVFRYGMTRQLVLGLEAVLADGTVISSLKKIIKDNTGYDLKQLFIGSEGTLGVVTRAVLKLVEAPKSRTSAFVAFTDYERVVDFLKYADAETAGTLSSYELIWRDTFRAMTSPPATVKAPLPSDYPYYVLLETTGSDPAGDRQRLEDLLEAAFTRQMIADAAVADTEADLRWFWTIREDVHVVKMQAENDHHFDISLPIPLIGRTIADITAALRKIPEVTAVFPFGHIADGNVHFIIGKENTSPTLTRKINETVYAPLTAIGGSVSAEHGIGTYKKAYLSYSRTPAEIELMRTLKRALDPRNILNPGKILDV